MEEERLSLLRASIEAQRREIEKIFAKIEERRRGEGTAHREASLTSFTINIRPKRKNFEM